LSCLKGQVTSDVYTRLTAAVLHRESTATQSEPGDQAAEISELVERLQGSKRESIKRTFAQDIAAAESAGDRQKVKQLMVELQRVIAKETLTE